MCPEEVRQQFVRAALEVVGLGDDPDDPARQQRYRDLIAPGETPSRQREMARMSGCALVVAGIWRSVGVAHRILSEPYVDRTAVSRLGQIAGHAWVPYLPGRLPSPGDAVRIGDNTEEHGTEHMYVVTSIVGVSGPILQTVDGGQRDKEKHFQIIETKQRAWLHRRDVVVGTSSRTVMGWFDALKVASLIPDPYEAIG